MWHPSMFITQKTYHRQPYLSVTMDNLLWQNIKLYVQQKFCTKNCFKCEFFDICSKGGFTDPDLDKEI